jgi:hypothetical protein
MEADYTLGPAVGLQIAALCAVAMAALVVVALVAPSHSFELSGLSFPPSLAWTLSVHDQ